MAASRRPDARTAVALTGATGFIGSAVRADLAARGVPLRALVRGEPVADGHTDWVSGDLADPAALAGLCDGAAVLMHLASRVGGDAEECAAVNDRGTAALMAAADRAGIRRIVHLSTTAVYGEGPHTDLGVDGVPTAPRSATSRTRLLGERHALAAGAVVLRPALVTGTGDRWVVPALAELARRVPGRWAGGDARLSLVDRTDLARLVTALALAATPPPAGVRHACHPVPVRGADLIAALAGLGLLPAPDGPALPWEECRRRLAATPGRVSEHQFRMVVGDHWYRSDEVWRLADCPPGPGPLARLAGAAPWYRAVLGIEGRGGAGA
ncbi:NAD(P)-dependent oxidoreductase [Kitasatospora sp. NPDC089797]|uniref:NAD-dependent epimerase/dehydratase family protein n=1 Tax=Kitasatospora sp. NPDC089797 TaxID=3155298 RepID=UPI00341AB1C7